MKKQVYFFLILIVCLLAISCSFQRKENTSTFDPDFDTFVPDSIYRLRYGLELSMCDQDLIEISRPSYITLSNDAEIKIYLENDTISEIKIVKGHFRILIKHIQSLNSPEFTFMLSDFLCKEEYQKHGPSLGFRIFSKKGGTAFISFLFKDNDKSNICD